MRLGSKAAFRFYGYYSFMQMRNSALCCRF